MPKKAKELSALEIGRITEPGYHFVGNVAGLILQVADTRARSWILRASVGGKRRDIGLGGYPDVTLADARQRAKDARDKIKAGIDPVIENRTNRSALAAARAGSMTFSEAASAYIEAKSSGWKSAKHAAQWRATLETFAFPVIGRIGVSEIETAHVMRVIEPIWLSKTETASRVRGRIESVLGWAAVRGYRKGDNPARWRGHIDNLLAARGNVAPVAHHAALPFGEIGAFMADLRRREGVGARALEFAILTAARSGEVRGATWAELDLPGAVWTIPGSRMKAAREHRVPLCDGALKLLAELPRSEGADLVFPSGKNTPLSDATLTAVIRRMGLTVTAHGFRSSFRDWAGEVTAFDRSTIEHALAHQIADKAEAAYARGSQFEKRRRLMGAWAEYCSTVASDERAMVTPIRGAA